MLFPDIAKPARDHDGFVIPPDLAFKLLLENPEITDNVGSTKLVIERGPTDRGFNHDLQRRGDPVRLAVPSLPGMYATGNPQVGHGKPCQSRFWSGAASRRTFIANLPTGARGRSWKGSDSGRMVVGLDFHQDVHPFAHFLVLAGLRIRKEPVTP